MCKDCKYKNYPCDNDKKNPCNHCIYWDDDGYLEYREYEWDGITPSDDLDDW